MKRIAIVGASGFVGGTLFDDIVRANRDEPVPLIHSSGNAWRIARHGVALKPVSLLDEVALTQALSGCTHVVNCSRGSNEVMLRGLTNLLRACTVNNVRRLVHLSSVMVYGDPPHPRSVTEDAPAEPEKGTYGWIKLVQDKMVVDAARTGLQSVVLCPPNIGGTHSPFLLNVLEAIRSQQFALLDGGNAPCNLVDVGNLVEAILLSLEADVADGRRLFVTDDEDMTWGQVVTPLVRLAGIDSLRSVDRAFLNEMRESLSRKPRRTFGRAVKHLVSSDVRQAMRKDPLWEAVDTALRNAVGTLGRSLEGRLRLSIEGPTTVCRVAATPVLNAQLCAQQLRGVRHSCQAAKTLLGYKPKVSLDESMTLFDTWYRQQHGMNGDFWDLAANLYG